MFVKHSLTSTKKVKLRYDKGTWYFTASLKVQQHISNLKHFLPVQTRVDPEPDVVYPFKQLQTKDAPETVQKLPGKLAHGLVAQALAAIE